MGGRERLVYTENEWLKSLFFRTTSICHRTVLHWVPNGNGYAKGVSLGWSFLRIRKKEPPNIAPATYVPPILKYAITIAVEPSPHHQLFTIPPEAIQCQLLSLHQV